MLKEKRYSELAREVYTYYYQLKAQGKRGLCETSYSCGQHCGHKFGMSAREVSRYIRIHLLHKSLQTCLDVNLLSLRAAVELSYLGSATQEMVSGLIYEGAVEVTEAAARKLREIDRSKRLSREEVIKVLKGHVTVEKEFPPMRELYMKWGLQRYSKDELCKLLDKALTEFFIKGNKVSWLI